MVRGSNWHEGMEHRGSYPESLSGQRALAEEVTEELF
jgi:hypothetical protein